MTGRGERLLQSCKPAVSRHVLFAVAGVLWMIAGGLLCFRGAVWLGAFRLPVAIATETGAVVLAGLFYVSMFSRLVQRNIDRIALLPERACVFAFTAARGYVMIGLMMTAGILLRNSSLPREYLSLPYTAMGGTLLAGSVRFYRQFLHQAGL